VTGFDKLVEGRSIGDLFPTQSIPDPSRTFYTRSKRLCLPEPVSARSSASLGRGQIEQCHIQDGWLRRYLWSNFTAGLRLALSCRRARALFAVLRCRCSEKVIGVTSQLELVAIGSPSVETAFSVSYFPPAAQKSAECPSPPPRSPIPRQLVQLCQTQPPVTPPQPQRRMPPPMPVTIGELRRMITLPAIATIG
jgi:hypothetical protein